MIVFVIANSIDLDEMLQMVGKVLVRFSFNFDHAGHTAFHF